MRRALELAAMGLGSVSPNPMVGCVIVHGDRIIGEGYHEKYGESHAEVNAINAVEDQALLQEATVYVTLEPCAHWGKTPPCANLLVEKKIARVVIAAVDSNPLVGGKGIKILEEAGIPVSSGVLENQARIQNKRFFTQIEKQRPYVILKWAQTRDGFVARSDFSSKWISNSASRQLVHKWRSEEDGILVGKNTATYDDPSLNVREWVGKNPIRLVVDTTLQLPQNLKLFDQTIPTICFNILKSERMDNMEYVKLRPGFEISELLDELFKRNIQSIIVEGGSFLLSKFIAAELWDEARVFTSQNKFEAGILAPKLNQISTEFYHIQSDLLHLFYHV